MSDMHPDSFADVDSMTGRVVWIPGGVVAFVKRCAEKETSDEARDCAMRIAGALESYRDALEIAAMDWWNA